MNSTKLPVSLEDTTKLRKLIVDNPDLPLIVFVETTVGMIGIHMKKLMSIVVKFRN